MRTRVVILALCALALGSLQGGQIMDTSDASPSDAATITGVVVDESAAAIAGAKVRLLQAQDKGSRETVSGKGGEFSFAGVAAADSQLVVSAPGFSERVVPLRFGAGGASPLAPIALAVATLKSNVDVNLSLKELAQEQIEDEEKQRILGFIPNFYVSYVPDPVPLTRGQKFQLAWRTTVDPITLAVNGVIAGVQQAQNTFPGFGQGASGYSKRYAASYGTFVTGTVISSAILPALFKQDPRYFYKGSGSTGSRILYAVTRSFVAKGDNGRWQPAYSNIVGSLASSGLSNLYYSSKDRDGAALTFENLALGIAGDAAGNLFQEFLVRRLTPHAHTKGLVRP